MAILMTMHRGKGETPASLAVWVRTSTHKVYPNVPVAVLDAQMIQTFLQAMADTELQWTILAANVREFKKVVEVATRLDLADNNWSHNTQETLRASRWGIVLCSN